MVLQVEPLEGSEGLNEVMRMVGTTIGLVPLGQEEKTKELVLCLHHVSTQREAGLSQARKRIH